MMDDLKEKLKFPSFIRGTVPDAVYLDSVYTQLVLIEFAGEQKAYVFDGAFEGHMLCTPDMIGGIREVILGMLVSSLEKMEVAEKSVDTSLDLQGDYAGPDLDINGCIEEIIIPDDPKRAERWHGATVDFGVGRILIDIDRKYSYLQLDVGDYVHAYGRVDLRGIE